MLVDLSGHPRANRLMVFAREPAPVQVTAWGYATGTGLETMHYFLADEIVVPPEAHRLYSETVVNLPERRLLHAASVLAVRGPAAGRCSAATSRSARTTALTKITPESVEAWARVLLAVPDARLM